MKIISLMSSLFLLLSGCIIQSFYPFYTEETKVKLNEINGEWISIIQMGNNIEKKPTSPWLFSDKTIVSYDEKNVKSILECTCFKVGDNLFIDTFAGEPDTKINFLWSAGITLVHNVCKISLNKNTLVLTPINFEWFEERIKEKKLGLPYVRANKDSNYIFTARSEDWVKFLKKHGDNPEVFNKKYNFVFKRN